MSNPAVFATTLMFAEVFVHLSSLVRVMRARGLTRVLCVGHGFSREPAALARAGLSVVGLDLSARAGEVSRQLRLDDQSLDRLIGPGQEAPGGQLDFVTGDLMDPDVCRGPFDVIIERRTVQLFGDELARVHHRIRPFVRLTHPGRTWRTAASCARWRQADPGFR